MAGTEKEVVNIRTRTPSNWRAGTGRVMITVIADIGRCTRLWRGAPWFTLAFPL